MTTLSKQKVIGIAGTNGSGKDTVGKILADKHGYLFVSVTDLLRGEAQSRGQPVTREVLRSISAEWRRQSGLGVLVDKAMELYETQQANYKGLAVASLRNSGEADRIHELGGTVVWVDADPQVRYDRVQANAAQRDRVGEDQKTFEEFLAEEQAEMQHSGDKATLNTAAVKDQSDIFLNNDSDSIADLESDLAQALSL